MDHDSRLRWFAREVLPHEPHVRKWLTVRLRGLEACDVDEVIQEAYARIWTADIDRILNARAYLFVTARHIVGEHVRRSRIVAIQLMADLDVLNIEDDGISADRQLSGQEEIVRLQQVIEKLPPKCRLAFQLKKFEELSQREIAARMGVAESTVEKHLAKALRIVSEEMKALSGEPEVRRVDEGRFWNWGRG
ncbi:RNA polymerase sigma factor [Sphingosinicella rhizophila]|uniref:Sigma-70 family RNA polymerase sigma factor n=1 Tax=Sphingosinicella rhizophila TaxID=3050082 RepID=A0ABU3QBI0_9SPHN|nr:sigma-70 family RNA polymerase sigma factor [Sphingosinicella sp. GR2756]MDT9600310.1 sigma-70 family RNA polymerase sigma factor [Sphingosinicella sp. GR2756]